LRHYMKVLKDRGYEYGEHWGPHDIENREFAADAKSRKELAREGYEIDGRVYSMNFRVVPKAGIDTGIESVREILKSCVFDEEKCAVGISHLEGYRKE
ncbi:terminase, partial [Klebsiella pneumoniae]|nr:terminase [Klebsiella pneumoniae]